MEQKDRGGRGGGSTMHSYSLVPSNFSSDSQKDLSCYQKNRLVDSLRGFTPPN